MEGRVKMSVCPLAFSNIWKWGSRYGEQLLLGRKSCFACKRLGNVWGPVVKCINNLINEHSLFSQNMIKLK